MPESAHAHCVHQNTKAARALCRREHEIANTDMVVTHAFVFVRRARAEGFMNKLAPITLQEAAQEHGITKWDYRLALRMVLDRAHLMDETDLLSDEWTKIRKARRTRR